MKIISSDTATVLVALEDDLKKKFFFLLMRDWFENGAYSNTWKVLGSPHPTLTVGATSGVWSWDNGLRFQSGKLGILFRLFVGAEEDIMLTLRWYGCQGPTKCTGLDRNYRSLRASLLSTFIDQSCRESKLAL